MDQFSRQDSFLMRWFNRSGEFFGLSLLWLICCIPVVTAIGSSIALYDSVAHCLHGKDDHPYRRFFRTFKAELLRGMALTVFWAVVSYLLITGLLLVQQSGAGTISMVYSTFYAGTLLVPLAVLCWLIPLQSRFRYGFIQLHKMALMFSVSYLPTTAAIIGILLATVVIVSFVPVLMVLLPGICVTVQSFLIEKVFVQYMPEEEEDDDDI